MKVNIEKAKYELEDGDYLPFPSGEHLYIVQGGGINGCLYYGGGHTIHTYTGNMESGADIEVSVYDNIQLEIHRGRKHNPEIIITHDEWPCTVRIKKAKNMTVIVEEEKR